MFCPVCNTNKVIPLRRIRGKRHKKKFWLFFCLYCKSFKNPSGGDFESREQSLKLGLSWHTKEYERNLMLGRKLISFLLGIYPEAKTLLDVGAGIGSLMLAGKEYGLQCEGVEPNPYAVDYAKENFQLQISNGFFTSKLLEKKFDIVTCISVLEHIKTPRAFFKEITLSTNKEGIFYLSVPIVNKNYWKYVMFPAREGSPFLSSNSHLVHFSKEGLIKMVENFGGIIINSKVAERGMWGYPFRLKSEAYNI